MLSKIKQIVFRNEITSIHKNREFIQLHDAELEAARNELDSARAELESANEKIKSLREDLTSVKTNLDLNFRGHYDTWREKRVTSIVDHYGPLFFKDKKLLELGAGYGDIGVVFTGLGSQVSCVDAREHNVNIIKDRYPFINSSVVNVEDEWPFTERFDLIIHMGLLYHLDDFEFSLRKSLENTHHLILETEVCDSDDPDVVLKIDENRGGYDQSFIGKGSRPSEKYIEKILDEYGAKYTKIADTRCNSLFHSYNWQVQNTNVWVHGLRRFWFVELNS
jgi:2-polyprenyl-3-methyl-5-hydroxy-6-metoxy-1,4-benzoquinol methylase